MLQTKWISFTEKRQLATLPKLFVENQFNQKLGKDIENYLNDHFPHRLDIINTYFNFLFSIKDRIETVHVFGVDKNHVFNKRDIFLKPYQKGELERISGKLDRLQKILDYHQIKFYLFIPTNHVYVYPEYFEKYINFENMDKKIAVLLEYLKKHNPNVNIIYTLDGIKKEKNNYPYPLYSPNDVHPTDYGYFALYKMLINNIKKDYPDLLVLSEDDLEEFGSLKVSQNTIESLDNKRNFTLSYESIKYPGVKVKNTFSKPQKTDVEFSFVNPKGKYDILLLGTCIEQGVSQFLFYSFKNSFYVRENFDSNREYIQKHLLNDLINKKFDIFILGLPDFTITRDSFEKRLDDLLSNYKE